MIIGDRLRELREAKSLTQSDIEMRTGLSRCYISRVENGHTVPTVRILEKLARALEMPLYQLFYKDSEPRNVPSLLRQESSELLAWGSVGKDARYLYELRRSLGKLSQEERNLVLYMVQGIRQMLHKADPYQDVQIEVKHEEQSDNYHGRGNGQG